MTQTPASGPLALETTPAMSVGLSLTGNAAWASRQPARETAARPAAARERIGMSYPLGRGGKAAAPRRWSAVYTRTALLSERSLCQDSEEMMLSSVIRRLAPSGGI